jgi:Apea-like HEPN
MKLLTTTINLLREYLDIVEPAALSYRESIRQQFPPEHLEKYLRIVNATDRPNEHLLPTLKEAGRYFWRPQVPYSFLPHWQWIKDIDLPSRIRLADALATDLPLSEAEKQQYQELIPNHVDGLITHIVDMYLVLVIHLGQPFRTRAFLLAVDYMEISFDLERRLSFGGCYLYNFELESANTQVVHLADDVQIRLSTYGDVVRDAPLITNEGHPEGSYLPPAYMLIVKITDAPVHAQVFGYAHSEPSHEVIVEEALTALRLHQTNYVGRGDITKWPVGGEYIKWNRREITDPLIAKARGMWNVLGVPVYQLQNQKIEAVKQTLYHLRHSKGRTKLNTAITRFNNSYARTDTRERLIDLVIALENIFGEETTGQTTEVGYRLRMRAARYLGNTVDERQKLRRFFSNLYDLRSKVVHGDVKEVDNITQKKLEKPTEEIVQEAEAYVRIALRRMLNNPSHIGQDYLNNLLLGAVDV